MTHDQLLHTILDRGLVGIIRTPDNARLVDLVQVLYDTGITAFEITLTIPDALRVMRDIKAALPADVIMGAGTVLEETSARQAIDAGAEFLVSPTFDLGVVRTARRYGKISIPGAFTPTEIMTAWEAGADIVKVFPAEILGPGFFRSVRRPLPQVRLMPTGNIDLKSAEEFLAAGACGIGIGGPLSDPAAVAAGRFDDIRASARQYVELVRRHRAGK